MRLVVLVDHFPALSETFVVEEIAALRRAGHDVRVETGAWAAERAELSAPPAITCLAEDGLRRRALDLLWLAARRPRAVLADVRARRRRSREEPVHPLRVIAPVARRLAAGGERHVHVHFAAGAALDALRLSRLAGTSYSVVAHAYEIYRRPANLAEKLGGAAVAFGVSAVTTADLRAIAGPAANVRTLPMGVDPQRFARRGPQPGDGHVVAVGRLVEKKGFMGLVEAVGLLRDRGAAPARVTIVGDGPLRDDLRRRIGELGVEDVVTLAGARQPHEIGAVLEDADVLAVPSVIAADGDRDGLPVVVLEALAMELAVVASDLVGLPEVVRAPWGRLAPAGDVPALADALAEVLALPAAERAAAGAAARAWVVAERSSERCAAQLVAALEEAGVRG